MNVRAGAGEGEYLLVEGARNVLRLARSEARRLLRGPARTPAVVRANYELIAGDGDVDDFDFHRYVFGDPDQYQHVLLDDRVYWSSAAEPRKRFLPHLAGAIDEYTSGVPDPVVVEFGCGDGRNLLYLKKTMPHLRCVGVDISPASIRLSRRAAAAFGLDVDLHVADVTALREGEIGPADVCFSIYALQQMPRVFRPAVDRMIGISRRGVLLYEPVGELYPRSLRGYVSRIYIRQHDYMNGLCAYLDEIGARIRKAERLPYADNPLQEAVEIHLAARGEAPAT